MRDPERKRTARRRPEFREETPHTGATLAVCCSAQTRTGSGRAQAARLFLFRNAAPPQRRQRAQRTDDPSSIAALTSATGEMRDDNISEWVVIAGAAARAALISLEGIVLYQMHTGSGTGDRPYIEAASDPVAKLLFSRTRQSRPGVGGSGAWAPPGLHQKQLRTSRAPSREVIYPPNPPRGAFLRDRAVRDMTKYFRANVARSEPVRRRNPRPKE